MLTEYIQAAMQRATYEPIDDGTIIGEIPGFDGLWANAPTYEACQEDLQGAREAWLVLGLQMGHVLPVVDGLSLYMQRDVVEGLDDVAVGESQDVNPQLAPG